MVSTVHIFFSGSPSRSPLLRSFYQKEGRVGCLVGGSVAFFSGIYHFRSPPLGWVIAPCSAFRFVILHLMLTFSFRCWPLDTHSQLSLEGSFSLRISLLSFVFCLGFGGGGCYTIFYLYFPRPHSLESFPSDDTPMVLWSERCSFRFLLVSGRVFFF